MADIVPIFDLLVEANGTVQQEAWHDLGSIPVGKQWWLGHATFIAEDKGLVFELRPNIPGQSAGDIANTQLRGYANVAKEESKDADLNFYGNIATFAPVGAVSTGVEKLWLRIRSGSGTAGAWDMIMFYSLYG